MVRAVRERLSAIIRLEGAEDHLSADALRDLLEEISRGRSLNAAARERGLSWRHAWGILNRAASILGAVLVETTVGGRGGGGSRLTAAGQTVHRELVAAGRDVERALRQRSRDGVLVRNVSAPVVFVAATLESVETGLLDAIDRAFYRDTGTRIGCVAAGSGAALDLARSGRIDLTFTHAPDLEAEFIAQGWGESMTPIMRSSFVIVGSPSDPARIGELDPGDGPAEAFRRIAATRSSFISRGDRSGTHLRELALWRKGGVVPSPPWYRPANESGNHALLREAAAAGAYALVDQATIRRWGAVEDQTVLYRGDGNQREDPLDDVFSLLRIRRGVSDEGGYHAAAVLLSWLSRNKEHIVRSGAIDDSGTALFEPIA